MVGIIYIWYYDVIYKLEIIVFFFFLFQISALTAPLPDVERVAHEGWPNAYGGGAYKMCDAYTYLYTIGMKKLGNINYAKSNALVERKLTVKINCMQRAEDFIVSKKQRKFI